MSTVDGKLFKRMWIQAVPTGTIGGGNVTFTLSQIPLEDDAVILFQDGLALTRGVDYSLSGLTITMTTAPALGQTLLAQFVQKTGGN